jgi:protein-L-isoaspartate O-methyltransferase
MREILRHRFVPIDQRPSAYEDSPPTRRRVDAQPTIVGLMTEVAHFTGEE